MRYPYRNDDLNKVIDSVQSVVREAVASEDVREMEAITQTELDALALETVAVTLQLDEVNKVLYLVRTQAEGKFTSSSSAVGSFVGDLTEAGGVTLTRTHNALDRVDRTTYNFTSASLGDAAADREIVVCVMASGSNTHSLSSVTIAGVGATKVAAPNGSLITSDLWQASVPTGTSGTISVTFNEEISGCRIVVYRLTGIDTTAHATLTDRTTPSNQTTTVGGTLNVPTDGIILACSTREGGDDTGFATIDWDGVTQDVPGTTGSASLVENFGGGYIAECSTAKISGLASQTGREVDIDWTTSGTADQPEVTITKTDTSTDGSNTTTYTFSNRSIGSANSERHVVVAVMADAGGQDGNRTLSSATIGGSSATIDIQRTALDNEGSLSEAAVVAIIRRKVTSGSSATISLTFSNTMSRCAIVVYRVLNASGLSDTGSDANIGDSGGVSTTVNTPSNGAAIACATMIALSGNTVSGTSWSGSGWVEQHDADLDGTSNRQTSAIKTSGSGNTTPGVSWGLSSGERSLAAALAAATYSANAPATLSITEATMAAASFGPAP